MDVTTDAASGLESQDNAGKVDGLSDAISAAIEQAESSGQESVSQEADQAQKVKTEDAKGQDSEIAGDDRTEEDTDAGQDANTPKDADKGEGGKDPLSALDAPKHWPEARKKVFDGLAPEGRKAILDMARDLEGGFTRKSQELSDKVKFADTISGLVDQATAEQIKASGADLKGYFEYLNQVQQYASRDPVGYLKWAMQTMDVSPDQLGFSQANAGAQPEEQLDPGLGDALMETPEVKQLRSDLDELKNWRQQRESTEQTRQREAYQTQLNTIQGAIGEFRSALDDTGQLKYPHFDDVQRDMGALMDSNPSLVNMPDGPEKLEKAYDMAVYARPDLRQSYIDAEVAKRAEQEAKAKRDEAARAKQAAGIKPAAGVATQKANASSLDDALSQSFAKHGL